MTDAFWVAMGAAVVAGLTTGLPGFFAYRVSVLNSKKAVEIKKETAEIKTETAEIKHQTNSELSTLRSELSALRAASKDEANTFQAEIRGLRELIASMNSNAKDAKQVALGRAAQPEPDEGEQ